MSCYRFLGLGLTLALLALGANACADKQKAAPTPAVSPAPSASSTALSPAPLPSWIVSVAPTGRTDTNVRLQIVFQNDVVAPSSLETSDHQILFSHMSIDPDVPGHFVALTPRMIGFAPDVAIPPSTTFHVTLTRGLSDLVGDTLDRDYTWTFATEARSAAPAAPSASPLPPPQKMVSVAQPGTAIAVKGAAALLPVLLNQMAAPDVGGLDVLLSNTILPEYQDALAATLADHMPFATGAAARIRAGADQILLDKRYGRVGEVPELQKQIRSALTELRSMRRGDGGYEEWPGAGSTDMRVTLFCALSLAQARAAGIDVASDLLSLRSFFVSRWKDRALLGEPEPQRSKARLELLEGLDAAGMVRKDHLAQIYAARAKLSFDELIALARHLLRIPAWRARGIALRKQLIEHAYVSDRLTLMGAGMRESVPVRAHLVELLVDPPSSLAYMDIAMRMLLALRANGVWGSSEDNAQAGDAIFAYAKAQTALPTFSASVGIGDREFSTDFDGDRKFMAQWHLPMSELPKLSSIVIIRKFGAGVLHYDVSYQYMLKGDQPGTYAGLRLERVVRRGSDRAEVGHFGLNLPSAALTLEAKHVFEIEDTILTDHPTDLVVLNEALPAGLVTVNGSVSGDQGQPDYARMESGGLIAFMRHLEPGSRSIRYLVYAATPGTFTWPAARVYVRSAPTQYGMTSEGQVLIR